MSRNTVIANQSSESIRGLQLTIYGNNSRRSSQLDIAAIRMELLD